MKISKSIPAVVLSAVLISVVAVGQSQQQPGHMDHSMPMPAQTSEQSKHPNQGTPPQAPPQPPMPAGHAGHQMPAQPGAQSPENMGQMPGMDQMPGMQHQTPAPGEQQGAQQPAPAGNQEELPPVPALGRAQEQATGPTYTLEELEQMALKTNPTLAQAQAEIRSAEGRRLQVGLYPNPVIGYSGGEITGGPFRGGEHGGFVQQDIVLGGKLGLNRKVAEQDVRIAEAEREEQRLRVVNSVRIAFYQVLATQEQLQTDREFVQLAADTVQTAYQLRNVGQFDQTEALQAEIELQRTQLAVTQQENHLQQRWAQLAIFVGNPSLPLRTLRGRLDQNLPVLNREEVLAAFMQAPAVRIAQAAELRAEATVTRARREPIPDLQLRAGVQQNRELLGPGGSAVGPQGFAEVGIQLPIFNRNQGNVQAAQADLERAQQETRRVQLLLRERATAALRAYDNSRAAVDRYHNQMIPRAQQAYQAMLQRWSQMAASYPSLLLAQRNLFDLQHDYITSLENLWTNSIALQGLLLTDGLEAPARPSEVDQPVRETNIPSQMEQAR